LVGDKVCSEQFPLQNGVRFNFFGRIEKNDDDPKKGGGIRYDFVEEAIKKGAGYY